MCTRVCAGGGTRHLLSCSSRVEDEAEYLRRAIELYRRLLGKVSDERAARDLKKMIEEAERRLKEIERRSKPHPLPHGESDDQRLHTQHRPKRDRDGRNPEKMPLFHVSVCHGK